MMFISQLWYNLCLISLLNQIAAMFTKMVRLHVLESTSEYITAIKKSKMMTMFTNFTCVLKFLLFVMFWWFVAQKLIQECTGLEPSNTQHPSLKLLSGKSKPSSSTQAVDEREADSVPDSATAGSGDLLSAVTQLLQQTQEVAQLRSPLLRLNTIPNF